MNPSSNGASNRHAQHSGMSVSGEDTLRLIASLPAPEGLAGRVQAGLRNPPQAARVLRWRQPLHPSSGWMHNGWMQSTVARSAAAATIVCVVAGGGWQIYSRVQPAAAVRVLIMPSPVVPGGGGFSQSGARHVPQTLIGPVLKHPVAENTGQKVVNMAPASPAPIAGAATSKRKKAAARIPLSPAQ